MNGKRYFNEIKKKYAYINYFQSCIIIFLQNHQALQYTSNNAALVLKSILKKIGVLFLKPFPHSRLHLFIKAEALVLQVFL